MAIRKCLACMFAIAISEAYSAELDLAFEQGGKGWYLPRPNFSVQDGAGRNGTKGLVCEGNDTNLYQIAHLELPFKPGQRLDVSLWSRDESLSKGEPGMCVEYFGEKGVSYFGGAGFKLDKYQPKDPHVWRRFTARLGPIQPEVKHCRLRLYIGKGITGRCAYDDIEIEVTGTELRGSLFTDRSDDRAYDGDVRFIAKSYADLSRFDGRDVEGFFTVEGVNGAERIEPESFKDGRAEAVVKVDRLAPGPHQVAFIVRDKKNGNVIDDMRMSFNRLSSPEKAVSRFDQKKRMIIDGRPVYPILAYMSEERRADPRFIPAIKRSPIKDIVYYTQKPNRADLDFFHEHGIRVVESLIYFWAGDHHYCFEASAPDEEIALTVRTMNELKDHPALLGWYLFDEPRQARFPRIRERYKTVRALDPDHFCLTVINGYLSAHDAAATCDVLGLDCYPIPKLGTEQTNPGNLGQVSQWIGRAHAGLRGGKPLWIVPQAFVGLGSRRFPTYHEMRSMVWQAIAGGADGVLFYSLEQMLNPRNKDWFPFDESWDIVCRVAQEIRDNEQILLSEEPPPQVKDCPPGIVARAWRLGGETLLAVCNATLKEIKTNLDVEGRKVPVSLAGHDVLLKRFK